MLVTSIFSFSHNVFYHFQNKLQFLGYIYFVVCICFESGPVQNFVVWERDNCVVKGKAYIGLYLLCRLNASDMVKLLLFDKNSLVSF